MGCGASTEMSPSDTSREAEKLPPVHKRQQVPKMNRRDLAEAVDDSSGIAVVAPTTLPSLDTQVNKQRRYDLASPDMDNAPTRSSAQNLPLVLPNSVSKGYAGQASLSTSTQRQYGLSDNTSQRSSSVSDDEWNPREFGPVMDSFCAGSTRHCTDLDGSSQQNGGFASAAMDDSEDVGFYLHFLQRNGAAAVQQQRTVSAKELLGHAAADNARTRFLMGGGGGGGGTATPPRADGTRRSPGLTEGKKHRSRYTAARELGPVDPDTYLDSLYEHSRERDRTHFFIDPDGEIRRLYHTEGWHLLGSAKRRAALQRHRSGSADSSGHRRGHRSRRGSGGSTGSMNNRSGGGGRTSSVSGSRPLSTLHNITLPRDSSTALVMQPRTSTVAPTKPTSPSDRDSGAAPRIRNTRFGSSGMLSAMAHAPHSTVTPLQPRPPASSTMDAHNTSSSRPYGSPVPQKSTSPPETKRVNTQTRSAASGEAVLTESGASVSLGSGLASTVPGSRSLMGGGADFFSQAFGGCGSAAVNASAQSGSNDVVVGGGATPPPLVQPQLAPILVRTEGDHLNSTSRRGSFNSSRRDAESVGDQPDSASPRRRLSTRRVSFSQGTRYFKKDPFYLTPRSDKTSEYDDLTPPEKELVATAPQEAPAAAAPSPVVVEAAPCGPTPTRPETSTSYAQLTLLKDKMTQNRDRMVF